MEILVTLGLFFIGICLGLLIRELRKPLFDKSPKAQQRIIARAKKKQNKKG